MPKYKLPAPKNSPKVEDDEEYEMDDRWRRRLHGVPANKEILGALEAGASATITLKGKVCATRMQEREDGPDLMDFDFEVSEVMVDYGDNEYEKLAEDD